MLTSPKRRTRACTTGAGATTLAPGTVIARFEETTPGSGVGATPEACSSPSWRDVAWLTSGGGATIAVGPATTGSREGRLVVESGMTGGTNFEVRKLGRCGPFSLRSGALASWERSGATRIEPFRADAAGFRYTARGRGELPRSAGNDASGL